MPPRCEMGSGRWFERVRVWQWARAAVPPSIVRLLLCLPWEIKGLTADGQQSRNNWRHWLPPWPQDAAGTCRYLARGALSAQSNRARPFPYTWHQTAGREAATLRWGNVNNKGCLVHAHRYAPSSTTVLGRAPTLRPAPPPPPHQSPPSCASDQRGAVQASSIPQVALNWCQPRHQHHQARAMTPVRHAHGGAP